MHADSYRNYRIRRATAADLDDCMAIVEAARRFMREHGNTVQWADGYPGRDVLARDLDAGGLYVCCEAANQAHEDESVADRATSALSAPLACFALLPGPEPTYAHIEKGAGTPGLWLNDEPYLVFHRLAVRSSGGGVGSFCLRWIANQAANVRGDTHEVNAPMRAAFTKCGFRECGTIHLADGSPRIAYQHVR